MNNPMKGSEWFMKQHSNNQCPTCKGEGKTKQALSNPTFPYQPCPTCNGTGTQPRGTFEEILLEALYYVPSPRKDINDVVAQYSRELTAALSPKPHVHKNPETMDKPQNMSTKDPMPCICNGSIVCADHDKKTAKELKHSIIQPKEAKHYADNLSMEGKAGSSRRLTPEEIADQKRQMEEAKPADGRWCEKCGYDHVWERIYDHTPSEATALSQLDQINSDGKKRHEAMEALSDHQHKSQTLGDCVCGARWGKPGEGWVKRGDSNVNQDSEPAEPPKAQPLDNVSGERIHLHPTYESTPDCQACWDEINAPLEEDGIAKMLTAFLQHCEMAKIAPSLQNFEMWATGKIEATEALPNPTSSGDSEAPMPSSPQSTSSSDINKASHSIDIKLADIDEAEKLLKPLRGMSPTSIEWLNTREAIEQLISHHSKTEFNHGYEVGFEVALDASNRGAVLSELERFNVGVAISSRAIQSRIVELEGDK